MVEGKPWEPTERQSEFLRAADDEVLYGGAAGGGKSDALLVDALGIQQKALERPHYRALVIRQTFPELRALLERAQGIYPRVDAGAQYRDRPWTEWRFSSGAKIVFGSVERDQDVYAYQGHEYQWIGVDELGLYGTPYVWEYLSSRLRSPDSTLRCYMRATCNPGPQWIQDRWGIDESGSSSRKTIDVTLADGRTITRTLRFVPARLSDNPYLARDGNYEARLRLLPRVEREALLEGRWGVIEVPGAVYGEELSEARLQGRVTSVPYDRSALVSTYWDIGISDATAIWCVQRCGREWHLIDYYEERDKTAADAAGWLKSRGYSYGDHWLPHDAEARERGTGLTYQEVLERAGIHSRITPRMGVEEGISAAKMVFSQCWIDEHNCAAGIKTLQHYRREWKARQVQFAAPVHDWASHGADAFRYFAIASRMSADSEFKTTKMPPIKYPNMGIV